MLTFAVSNKSILGNAIKVRSVITGGELTACDTHWNTAGKYGVLPVIIVYAGSIMNEDGQNLLSVFFLYMHTLKPHAICRLGNFTKYCFSQL